LQEQVRISFSYSDDYEILTFSLFLPIGDLTFDLVAYILACVSCIAQAAYLLYVAKTGAEKEFNSFGLLFYNSLLAIPFVAVIAFIGNEYALVWEYPNLWDTSFQVTTARCSFFLDLMQ
jgi:hypothetical protein